MTGRKTLKELTGEIGEENVRSILAEYLMLQTAKAMKFDEMRRVFDRDGTVDSDTLHRILEA